MVPTTLLYPPPNASPKLTLRFPAALAADTSNVGRTIRTTDHDGVFAVMSIGCLVIAATFEFYVLFGIQ